MSARRRTLILTALAATAVFWLVLPGGPLLEPPARAQSGLAAQDSVISFLVRFGLTDQTPTSWEGSLRLSNGELVGLRNWHPRPGDEVRESDWVLSTRQGPNFTLRAWEKEPSTLPVKYVTIPGVVVDVRSDAETVLHFTTPKGEFAFKPKNLNLAAEALFLGGRVAVNRVPSTEKLSGQNDQDDFATLLGSSNGRLWVAWVAYRNQSNEVLARHFNGSRWGPVQTVTEKASDIFLVKMGRDSRGHVWAVWSAQENGNWDLYARRFDGQSWSSVQRLTEAPQPDIYHSLTTDAQGRLWLVWQGFRNGKSNIFARRFQANVWLPAEQISTSPANDWEPAVAVDSSGGVYVAWDTYDQGNYDVLMRRFAADQWEAPQQVADSMKFEAHVTLAVDGQDRVWAAWNESGTQWGKDSGFLVKKEATRLYQWRQIGVAVYSGNRWYEPANLNSALPEGLKGYNDFPILQADDSGRVWLFFRHRTLRIRDVPSDSPAHRAAWEIFGTSYDGDRWTHPIPFPFSQGRTDMRVGFARDGRGNLYAAWPTDHRDFEAFLFRHADVYVGRIPAFASAPRAPEFQTRVIPELRIFPVHPNEADDLARIREYRIESEGKTYRIYRGDTHRHTEFSMDGNNDGPLVDTYRYAMDAAELDFLGVSEHNHAGGADIEYINWLQQQAADLFMVPNRFAPLFVYERSLPYPNGHRNIVFAKRGNPTLPIPDEERRGETGAEMLYAYLKQYGGIAISHTSATNMGTDWRDNDAEVEPLVEIYQGDRVSAEYEGAPKAANRGDPSSAIGGFRPAGYVWNAWAKGYKLGIQASSDHLSNHISYACTIATDFTREGLLDAMRRRHSYGATDNIVLDYRLRTDAREYLQGDIVKSPGRYRLWVKVIGTARVRQIDIVRNNAFIHTTHPLKDEVELTFLDKQPPPGESYYYVRVIQVDNQMAWSSPIWIQQR